MLKNKNLQDHSLQKYLCDAIKVFQKDEQPWPVKKKI